MQDKVREEELRSRVAMIADMAMKKYKRSKAATELNEMGLSWSEIHFAVCIYIEQEHKKINEKICSDLTL